MASSLTNNKLQFTNTSINEIDSKLDILPVGFVYWQLPGQKAPGEFLAGNWVDITSQYAGLFFRAAGGDGLSFSEDSINIQSEGLPNIKGYAGTANQDGGYFNRFSGCFYGSESFVSSLRDQGNNYTYSKVVNMDASKSSSIYGNSSHVTPINTSIKIWVRQED